MASLLFLQLFDDQNKEVPGEVEIESHKDWIEIEGCSWSMEQRDEKQGTLETEANHAKPGKFNFSKFPDSSSTRLMQASVDQGIIFEKAVFHHYEELQGSETSTGGVFDLTITLSKVRISSYKINATNGDKSVDLKEDLELEYEEIDFDHKNAGVQVTIEKPRETDKGPSMSSSKAGASTEPGGAASGAADGFRDFLAPLGSF